MGELVEEIQVQFSKSKSYWEQEINSLLHELKDEKTQTELLNEKLRETNTTVDMLNHSLHSLQSEKEKEELTRSSLDFKVLQLEEELSKYKENSFARY